MQYMELKRNTLPLRLFKPLVESFEMQALEQKVAALERQLKSTQLALLQQSALIQAFEMDLEHLLSIWPNQTTAHQNEMCYPAG